MWNVPDHADRFDEWIFKCTPDVINGSDRNDAAENPDPLIRRLSGKCLIQLLLQRRSIVTPQRSGCETRIVGQVLTVDGGLVM